MTVRVELFLETGFAGCDHEEIMEFPDDITDEEIEEEYIEWKNGLVNGYWKRLSDEKNEEEEEEETGEDNS